MIREGSFGPAEAVILLAISNIARFFLPYPRSLAEIGGPAAWLTLPGGLLIVLAGVYVMSVILNKYPGKTIIEIIEEVFGPVLGTVFNLVIFAFFLSVGALFTREFAEAMIITALPETPISVITVAFLAMGLAGAYLGIEALARASRLSYLYVLGGIVLLLLAMIPQCNLDNLFPLLGRGPLQVLGNGSLSTAGVTEIILAGVLVQAMGGAGNFLSIGFRAMLLAYGIALALMVTLVMTIHYQSLTEFTLPFYQLAKLIYLGRFFQRVEAVFVIIWSVVGALKIALTLYGATVSLTRLLKLPDYRPLLWPLGLVMFIVSLLPPDMPASVRLDLVFLRPFALVPNYLIPLLVLAVYWLRGRGRRAGS
ncbi:MAG: endospore germination permease [Peptococcaceae bacterium MAG4]|nr:endospore germination permease [Peptococcaceae bacterium MAG4]